MKILLQQKETLEKQLKNLGSRYELLKENKQNESKNVDYDLDGFTDTGAVDLSYQVMGIHDQIEDASRFLDNCEIVDSNSETIQLGSIFTLTFLDDNDTRLCALSDIFSVDDEIDFITTESSLGKAVLGKKENDVFTVNNNGILNNIRIDSIHLVKENQKKIEK